MCWHTQSKSMLSKFCSMYFFWSHLVLSFIVLFNIQVEQLYTIIHWRQMHITGIIILSIVSFALCDVWGRAAAASGSGEATHQTAARNWRSPRAEVSSWGPLSWGIKATNVGLLHVLKWVAEGLLVEASQPPMQVLSSSLGESLSVEASKPPMQVLSTSRSEPLRAS